MEKRQGMLEFTYMCSPFYQKLMEGENMDIGQLQKDWESVPVVDKSMLTAAGESVVPFSYYPKKARGELLKEIASGSTGKCLKYLWSREDKESSIQTIREYREKWYHIQPHSPFCYFYTIENQEATEEEYTCVEDGMGIPKKGLNRERIEEIYERLLCYQPEWIMIAPSVAMLLANYVKENQKEKIESLKYIELSGEMCSEEDRDLIQDVFQCLAKRKYGCKEVGTIAYECPCGKMHIVSENVYAEICRNGHNVLDGEEGSIVVTSKWNHVTPFVRYNTDDLGIIRNEKCECGMEGPVLEVTRGQKNEWIRRANGEVLHSSEFARIFLHMMYQQDIKVEQYHVIQREYDLFDVYIVSEGNSEQIISAFRKEVENTLLRDAQFQFHFQNEKFLANRVDMDCSFQCAI